MANYHFLPWRHTHSQTHIISHSHIPILEDLQWQPHKTRQEFVVCWCQKVQTTSLQKAAMFQLISLEKPVTGTVSGWLVTRERMNAFIRIQLCMCVFVSVCACVMSAGGKSIHYCKFATISYYYICISWLSVQELSGLSNSVLSNYAFNKKEHMMIVLVWVVY